MCGIAGLLTFDKNVPSESLLHDMTDSLTHRGPDEAGYHLEPGVGLGHRRLSIIDLSSGQQPMFSADGSVIIIFNGEIYNHRELSTELKQRGHEFSTQCDTEAIIYAYMEWGVKCIEKLRGMFAFTIYDRRNRTTLMARDRLGIKPLYYAQLANRQLIFGSELKALLVHPDLKREINPQAVEEYFAFGYVPEPHTIYQSVHKLEPGFFLTIDGDGNIHKQQYWDVPFEVGAPKPQAELEEELIERLAEAVKIRMVADVPLGAFLSGGVDSSAVVALMAEQSDKPVSTCSIAFEQQAFDESSYAEMVSRQYQTDHRVKQVDPNDYRLIDELINLYDEPYADSSALPTYRVCQIARERVTVALSGDGGDENFAGYRRYLWHTYEERARSMMPAGIRQPLFGFLGRVYPKLDWAPRFLRGKSTFQSLARDAVSGYFHSVSILDDSLRSQLFTDKLKSELQGHQALDVMRAHAAAAPTDHPLSLIQYLDFKTYLVGDILTKVDRASMAHSLEVRVPILDHKFVEWASSIAPEQKLNNGEGKYVFKKSLESRLPNDILYRKKMGFSIPLGEWFRGELRDDIRTSVLSPTLLDTGFFEEKTLKKILDQHQSGLRDYSAPLWTTMMFEKFLSKVHNE